MHNVKKYISTTLAAIMVAGCGTMTFAKTYDDVTDDNAAKTEISILSDIGVIKGTSEGVFSPKDDVTREQMSVLLFRLMLGRDDAGKVNTTSFTDLYDPYYNGAISWANAAGYIIGTSKNTFDPTGGITKQDAMTMLVRALGQDNEKMNDNYPWSYINAGIKLGLDRGLESVDYTDTLTREETAVMLFNALTSEYLVGRTTATGNIYYESTSIIEEVFGYNMAEATVVATNDYTVDGSTVVKNDYVTLECTNDDGTFKITVPYADMGLDGDANVHMGMNFRVIFSLENGRYTVLSAVPMTTTEEYDSITVNKDAGNVQIGDNKYTLVEEYSDELSTNNNELILYAYDEDGTIEIVSDLDELETLLGFYKVTLMFDNESTVAKRAFIRVFEMDLLDIDGSGKINIAGNKTDKDITVYNPEKAISGDYVLYYYNANAKELHISTILDIADGTVKRITRNSAQIGEKSYALGNTTAGISAESIRQKLSLGSHATVVIYKDAIVAVEEGVSISRASQYLVSLTDAYRVYENGTFRYVMTAFIDGVEKNIYVTDSSARAGNVYRYTETAGVFTLINPKVEDGIIISGNSEFIQNTNDIYEIAYMINAANGTTIELGGRNYYTLNNGSAQGIASVAGLSGINFVCDKNTVIIVSDNGKIMQNSGAYSSTITVNDGAKVVAIFNNEVGSVETLKYLFISDGSLGNYDIDAEFVRVLAENGYVYEDGTAYVEYIVYNFSTGKVETRLSRNAELTIGADYRCGTDDTITSEIADLVLTGFVNGYTSATVSIDGSTYTLAEDVRIIRLTSSNTAQNISLADVYMRNIEFIAENGEIKLIIESDAATFTAAFADGKITVTPDFDLSNFSDSEITVASLKLGEEAVSVEGFTAAATIDGKIEVTVPVGTTLANGTYTMGFKIGTKTFSVSFTVAV